MFRLLFIFSLGFLYVLVVSSQVNACISEFDLLLSTCSKWLYNDQFRPHIIIVYYMYIAHFHITYFPNLIVLIDTKFMLPVALLVKNLKS